MAAAQKAASRTEVRMVGRSMLFISPPPPSSLLTVMSVQNQMSSTVCHYLCLHRHRQAGRLQLKMLFTDKEVTTPV